MNKDTKVRGNVVKESILDYEQIKKTLRENTASAVQMLLNETVRDTYAKLLTEDEDSKDYEVEETEDTGFPAEDGAENEGDVPSEGDGSAEADQTASEAPAGDEPAADGAEEGGEQDEWAQFDKYSSGEGEYDLSQAEDEDVVKIYKLMSNEDEVIWKDEGDKYTLQDNQTGAEYIITKEMAPDLPEGDAEEGEIELELDNGMNESTRKTYELVMEYDSHMGYTDNYQNKDVMTTDGVSEPGKNVNDWDKGVPHDTKKPWSGYPGKKKNADKPFNGEKGKKVEESVEECGDGMVEPSLEEATNVGGFVQQNSTSKSHVPNSNGRKARNASKGGSKVSDTSDPRYGVTKEELERKVVAALKENEELRGMLTEFRKFIKEAAATNSKLGYIVRLMTENSTTAEEKQAIVNRFLKEETKPSSAEESEKLYHTISEELKQSRNKLNIQENAQLNAEPSKTLNETTIYKSKDMLDSLDLMHRLMKR